MYRQKIINVQTKGVYRIEVFNAKEEGEQNTIQPIPVGYDSNYLTTTHMINGLVATASKFAEEDQMLVAINVSNSLLVDTDLLDIVLHKLDGLPYGLSIEVTQLGVLPEPRKLNAVFSMLRQRNCSIEFDNFGGSNSQSPQVLSEYSFDSMKLNSTFMRSMLRESRSLRLLKLIIDMVKAQGKRIIATGVSGRSESEQLVDIGIFLQQGDYIHAPELVA